MNSHPNGTSTHDRCEEVEHVSGAEHAEHNTSNNNNNDNNNNHYRSHQSNVSCDSESMELLISTFRTVFGETISLVLDYVNALVCQCCDAVGLLLMVGITQQQKIVMQERHIHVLDPFFDEVCEWYM